MEDQTAQALRKLFDAHRIVFWYDAKRELREQFESLELADVEKVEIADNEFQLKYRMLRAEPDRRFLLYHEGEQPPDLENWLLDVQLCQGEFRTDQTAIWLSELGLGLEFSALISEHAEFFRSSKRLEVLKELLSSEDTAGVIRLKMVAACVSAEPRMDVVVETLLQELADEREEKYKLLERCELDGFLWDQAQRLYGYNSKTPGLRDFVIELFKSCYAMGTEGSVRLISDALVFLKRWKDNRNYGQSFEKLSDECAQVLGVEQDLLTRDLRDLLELDYFRLIDKKILGDLVQAVASRTASTGDIALWVRQRRQSYWYDHYRDLYEAIDYAAQFMSTLAEASLKMSSLADGVQRYCQSWYRLDQLYRKFIFHVRRSGEASLMEQLSDQIEKLYSNNFLLKLNDNWQTQVDSADLWTAATIVPQRQFFHNWVKPFLDKGKKVYVIVSDALRYEIADELLGLVRQEDRYDAQLECALSALPSYTQLGMAALLPNKELALADNESSAVLVDGQSAQGTANRLKILSQALSGKGTALLAEELMAMNKEECRALVRDHDVVYVYHNLIDSTGDKRATEGQVFDAVEDTLGEVVRLVKKLTAANASNLLVTADHGFIYQNQMLEESDFLAEKEVGDSILFKNRRFVLGKGLRETPGLKKFTAEQIGLKGPMEVLIPKSINRLRVQGAGSRFVHGGAALQEVVIPVLKINKKRQSDISAVEVDILGGASSVISSGQLSVVFYQVDPATDKIQPRRLRTGIYTQRGDLISDSHELVFDLASENPRERELKVRFVLTRAADEANGQDVVLKLEEPVPGTSHYKDYKALKYSLRRSFTSDFDF